MNTREAAVLLKAARGLIAMPNRWTSKAWARDSEGKRCNPRHAKAVAFDASGAVARVVLGPRLDPSDEREWSPDVDALVALVHRLKRRHLIEINDGSGHLATVSALDDTIDWLERDPARVVPNPVKQTFKRRAGVRKKS